MFKKNAIISTTMFATACVFVASAHAGPLSVQKGYDLCGSEIRAQGEGVTLSPIHFLQRRDTTHMYYINSTAWEDGERVHQRSACETKKSGRKILALETSYGRWKQQQGVVGIEVASQ